MVQIRKSENERKSDNRFLTLPTYSCTCCRPCRKYGCRKCRLPHAWTIPIIAWCMPWCMLPCMLVATLDRRSCDGALLKRFLRIFCKKTSTDLHGKSANTPEQSGAETRPRTNLVWKTAPQNILSTRRYRCAKKSTLWIEKLVIPLSDQSLTNLHPPTIYS